VNPRRLRGLAAVVAALAMLAFVGSAATNTSTSKPDLTTVAGINAYLTSLGIDPATVVRQNGLLNYAGPSSGCPGIGWNCTEATTVVQTAPSAGTNNADITCRPADPASTPGNCVIVQVTPSGTNKAMCHQHDTTPTASEFCTVTQTNGTGKNDANIDQEIDQNGATTVVDRYVQDGRQYANVMQMNESGDNQAQVFQAIHQDLSTGDKQNQDGHQVAKVDQGGVPGPEPAPAEHTGNNSATVNQSQDQSEIDQGVTTSDQEQNTSGLPSDPNAGGDARFIDCNPNVTSGGVFEPAPNLCANINQEGSDALNNVYLDQSTNQDQRTDATRGHQIQGLPAGGLDGSVTQPTTGTANLHANPTEAQSQRAPTGFMTDLSTPTSPTNAQQQWDGNVCCATSPGKNSSVNIDQSSNQSAVGSTSPTDLLAAATPNSDAFQDAVLFGHGMSEGSVTIAHSIKQNGPGAFTASCPPKGPPPPPGDAPSQTCPGVLFSHCANGYCVSTEGPPCSVEDNEVFVPGEGCVSISTD
jgi:hypothetical protein